jgi:hypothetical protein
LEHSSNLTLILFLSKMTGSLERSGNAEALRGRTSRCSGHFTGGSLLGCLPDAIVSMAGADSDITHILNCRQQIIKIYKTLIFY